MEKIIPFVFVNQIQEPPKAEPPIPDITTPGPLDFLVSDKPTYITEEPTPMGVDKAIKRKTKKLKDGSVMITDDGSEDLLMSQSNKDYMVTYDETSDLLKQSVSQIDLLSAELRQDLETLRNSKFIKNKFTYIPNITATLASLLNTKISAVREINNSITQSHNLDLKRAKEISKNIGSQDDSKLIYDLYNSFISAPNASLVAPTMGQMTSGLNNMITESIGDVTGYTPSIPITAINAMKLEKNPDIKPCVMYDPSSGRRWFEVKNIKTGETIPGVEPPDMMFMEDTTIDLNTMMARNINIDTTYPVILVGDKVNTY